MEAVWTRKIPKFARACDLPSTPSNILSYPTILLLDMNFNNYYRLREGDAISCLAVTFNHGQWLCLVRLQTIQHKLAEMKTEICVARSFVDSCISIHNRDGLDSQTASMAKYWSEHTYLSYMDLMRFWRSLEVLFRWQVRERECL